MPTVFINYHRADTEAWAGRLFDALTAQLPDAKIFMDVDSLHAGEDFVDALSRTLVTADVVLVLIGRSWLTVTDDTGTPRLHKPNDLVRVEIADALRRHVSIIPVLVQGAAMPSAAGLTDDIRDLSRRQALELRHNRWPDDVAHLVSRVKALLRSGEQPPLVVAPPLTETHPREAPLPSVQTSTALPPTRGRRVSGRAVMVALSTVALLMILLYAGSRWMGGNQSLNSTPSPMNVVPLTTAGNVREPALSPDGKYVVYIQQDGTAFSLWTRQIATGSNVRIVDADAALGRIVAVTISPDGSFADFVRGPTPLITALWRVALLGGQPKKLFDNLASPIGWSPDGKQMAFVRADTTAGWFRLIIANADGSGERTLTERRRPASFANLAEDIRAVRPAWSPDGRTIAVAGSHANDTNLSSDGIVFVDTANAAQRSVPAGSRVYGVEWLDAGSLMVNFSEPGETRQLWRMHYPSGQSRRVSTDVSDYRGISFSKDHSTFVTVREERLGAIWMGNADGSGAREVIPPNRVPPSFNVEWAGKALLYPVRVAGRTALNSFDGTTSTELVRDAESATATTDGRTIVFVGQGGLWKVDQGGGGRTQILREPSAQSPDITPDNKYVVFESDRAGATAIWTVPLDGTTPPRQLVSDYALGPEVSPDGRRLLFGSHDSDRRAVLVVCDLPHCSNRSSYATMGQMWRWAPDSRGIASIDADRRNIAIKPLDDSAARRLTNFTDREVHSFAFSPDGQQLAIVRVTVLRDLVLFSSSTAQDGSSRGRDR